MPGFLIECVTSVPVEICAPSQTVMLSCSIAAPAMMQFLPIVALVTILAGLELMRRVSGGFDPAWTSSPMGMALRTGALSARGAFLLGVVVMRPAMMQGMTLTQAAMQVPAGPDRVAQLAAIGPLRRRATLTLRWVALLLGITVSLMAVARYL